MIRTLFRVSVLFLVLSLLSVSNSRKRHRVAWSDTLEARHESQYYLKKASDGRLRKHDGLVVNIEIEKHKKRKHPNKLSRIANALRDGPSTDKPTDKPADKICGWTLAWKCINGTNSNTPWWPSYPSYYPYYWPYYYYYYPYYWWG